MEITIITAVYNGESTIGNSLDSLYKQTYKNFEHVIIDGDSSDKTVKVIKSKIDNRSIIHSEKDKGIYDALNKGILLAKGDIIGILHSDDFYSSNEILEKVVETFEINKCDLLYADLEYISKNNSNKKVREWVSGKFDKVKLKYGWMPPHPTVFMKTDLIKKIGFYDTNYKISSDYDFLLRCLLDKNIKVEYLQIKMIKMKVGGISNRSIKNILLKMNEDYSIIKKNKIYFIAPIITLLLKNVLKVNQIRV